MNDDATEAARVSAVYAQRGYDTDPEYQDGNPVYLHRIQRIERETLAVLRVVGWASKLGDMRILDFGCGNGGWLGRWISWGANPVNLSGVDVRASAISLARSRFPGCELDIIIDGCVPHASESFDIVVQNVVFGSILDDGRRHRAALEISRVLKVGGLLLWCDAMFNNPWNLNVRRVSKRDVRSLFPGFSAVIAKRVVLAPPIARQLVPLSWLAAEAAESCVPFLRTHLFAALRKEPAR